MRDTANNLLRSGLWLEYATLGWNVVGFSLLLWAAYLAHSVALMGFGMDSAIEILASVIVVWQLKAINRDKEKVALKLIGGAFFLLAAYILIQSIYVLRSHVHAATSVFGMVWLLLTLGVMLPLSYGKSYVGKRLNHPVLQSEANITLIDALLAGIVLLGLILNFLFSWWWADSAASLVILFYGVKEGVHTFKDSL